MAIYDDFLGNDLYSRPSSLISDVNNYLGVDDAKLPQSASTLGSMAGVSAKSSLGSRDSAGGKAGLGYTLGTNTGLTAASGKYSMLQPHTPGPDITGIGRDDVGHFVKQLSVLSEPQRNLLLQFINSPGGVEPSEYAELFNVPDEYSNRFQGLPNMLNLKDQLANISAYGAQQRGYEMDAVQQAQIASKTSRRGQLVGGREPDDTRRRTMVNTLNQRLSGVREATAGKFNQLLQNIQNALSSGYQTQADIYAGGGQVRDPNQEQYRTGETIVIAGTTYYYYQGDWLTEKEWNALEGVDK
jgi:hypothetical protein